MPAAMVPAGAAAPAAVLIPTTLPHERSRSGGSRRREKRRAATVAASSRATLEDLEQEILALKQANMSRNIKVASLEVNLLELDDRLWRLAAHVLDRVLVAEPVAALDRVLRVPAPVVLAHVAQRGVDAALGGHGVRARREQLGDAPEVGSFF